VLGVLPVLRAGPANEGEVALIAEMPEDVSVACAVLVIHLDYPVLVANGDEDVVVVGGVDDGVGVGPVGKFKWSAGYVEVVKLVPDPVYGEVVGGVDIDEDVAEDVDALGVAFESVDELESVGDDDPMSGDGIDGDVVVDIGEGDLLALVI
jgi:hypothetical protein